VESERGMQHDQMTRSVAAPESARKLDLRLLRMGVHGWWLGNPLVYLAAGGSTTAYAAELADAGAREGTVVIAEHVDGSDTAAESARPLSADDYPLVLTLILRARFAAPALLIAAVLAAAEALERVTGARTEVRGASVYLPAGRPICAVRVQPCAGATLVTVGLAPPTDIDATPREELVSHLLHRLDRRCTALLADEPSASAALQAAWTARTA
jgi:hypothetical protein